MKHILFWYILKESAEVELLCGKVQPEEWTCLIREWRQRVALVQDRDKVLRLFRCIVEEICAERFNRTNVISSLHNISETGNNVAPVSGTV